MERNIYYSDKYYDVENEYRYVTDFIVFNLLLIKMSIFYCLFNAFHVKSYFTILICCRHVVLPKEMVKLVPKTHLMSEQEWRGIGIQQSKGWVHYMIHSPG